MQSALVIARILGPLYVIVSVGMVLTPSTYQRVFEEFRESAALTYLGGMLALGFGLLVLAVHPVWRADWTAVITVIGWLGVIKGSLLIVRPSSVIGVSRPLMAKPAWLRLWAVAPLALGLYLCLKGFSVM